MLLLATSQCEKGNEKAAYTISSASTREYFGPAPCLGSTLNEYADGALVEAGLDVERPERASRLGLSLSLLLPHLEKIGTARLDLLR